MASVTRKPKNAKSRKPLSPSRQAKLDRQRLIAQCARLVKRLDDTRLHDLRDALDYMLVAQDGLFDLSNDAVTRAFSRGVNPATVLDASFRFMAIRPKSFNPSLSAFVKRYGDLLAGYGFKQELNRLCTFLLSPRHGAGHRKEKKAG